MSFPTATALRNTTDLDFRAVDNHSCPTCYVNQGRKCVTVGTLAVKTTRTHVSRLRIADKY